MKKLIIFILIIFTILLMWFFSKQSHKKEEIEVTTNSPSIEKIESSKEVEIPKGFINYTFKNEIQLFIPESMILTEEKNDISTFSLKNANDNNRNVGIVITLQPKKSTLSQENILDASESDIENYRVANENIMSHILQTTKGWENSYVIYTTSKVGKVNNLNYLLTEYGIQMDEHQYFSKLFLIPTMESMVRVQYYYKEENKKEFEELMKSLKLKE